MSWKNHAEYGNQSFAEVRPRSTDHVGELVHKKATMLNMSARHRFSTDYPVSAAMNGFRGDPMPKGEITREMVQQSFHKSETPPKKGYGPTAQHNGAIGATPTGLNSNSFLT